MITTLQNLSIEQLAEVINQGVVFEQDNFCQLFAELNQSQRKYFLHKLIESAAKDIKEGGFRSYDIRINSEALLNHVVFYIGLKASYLLKKFTSYTEKEKFVVGIGRAADHARPSSSRIHKCYLNAFKLKNILTINLGVTTTPDVYFAAAYLKDKNINAVINISASHNPRQDNGIKHCIVSPDGFIHSISADQLHELKNHCVDPAFKKNSDLQVVSDLCDLSKWDNINNQDLYSADFFSTVHNAFIVAFALLGPEVIKALNKKFQGDFKMLLEAVADNCISENILEQVVKITEEKWQDLLKRLNLDLSIKKPHQFKHNPLKDFVIALDYGQGSAYRTGVIYRALGAYVEEVDADRGFNPLETKNQINLIEALKKLKIKFSDKEIVGLSHDEDGDRLGVMRSDLIPVGGDRLLVIGTKQLVSQNSGDKKTLVVTEVKSRPETRTAISDLGALSLIVPTGFAFIKQAAIDIEKALRRVDQSSSCPEYIELYGTKLNLKEITSVQMWAELSGHFGLSQDVAFLFDDASLMAVNLLMLILKTFNNQIRPGQALISLDSSFPKNKSSDELNIFIKTDDENYIPSSADKEDLVEEFFNYFKDHPSVSSVSRIDGVEILFKDPNGENIKGWILARKSNNEDKIVVVTSAATQISLDEIETIFFDFALKVSKNRITGLVLKKEDEQGEERKVDPYVADRIKILRL